MYNIYMYVYIICTADLLSFYSWLTQACPNSNYLCSSIYSRMISSFGRLKKQEKLQERGSPLIGLCNETELNRFTLISKFAIYKLAPAAHSLPIYIYPLLFL